MDEAFRREILDLPTRHRSTTIPGLLAATFPGDATPEPPATDGIRMVRPTPEVVPALDCSQGFGHARLVTP